MSLFTFLIVNIKLLDLDSEFIQVPVFTFLIVNIKRCSSFQI